VGGEWAIARKGVYLHLDGEIKFFQSRQGICHGSADSRIPMLE
jgi:hypothetical protein